MFDDLRNFLRRLGLGAAPERHFGDDDVRLAFAGLLVHSMAVDGAISGAERERLREALRQEFGLKGDDLDILVEDAVRAEREAVDLYRFTSVLTRVYDAERRVAVVERLWDIVHADGKVHEFEDNLVWRVAELLGVARHDRLKAKADAASRADAASKADAAPGAAARASPENPRS